MDAALGPRVSEGVAAGDLDSGALDPRLFASHDVDDVCLEAALVRPAQVHSEEHLCPILRVGAARAGMDCEYRVAAVVLAGEGEGQLHLPQFRREGVRVLLDRFG